MQGIPVLLCGIVPVPLNRGPALAESFLISVAILGNDGGHAFGMRKSEAPAHRGAVVVNHQCTGIELKLFGELSDGFRQLAESVSILISCGGFGKAGAAWQPAAIA